MLGWCVVGLYATNVVAVPWRFAWGVAQPDREELLMRVVRLFGDLLAVRLFVVLALVAALLYGFAPPPPAGAQPPPEDAIPSERGERLATETWTYPVAPCPLPDSYTEPNPLPEYMALASTFGNGNVTSGIVEVEVEQLTRSNQPLRECVNGSLVVQRHADNSVIRVDEVYGERITVWCLSRWSCTWDGTSFSYERAPLTTVPEEVPYVAPDQNVIDAAPLSRGTVGRISDRNRNVRQYSYPAWTTCGEHTRHFGGANTRLGKTTRERRDKSSESDPLEWALLQLYYVPDGGGVSITPSLSLTPEQNRVWQKFISANGRIDSLTEPEKTILNNVRNILGTTPGRSDFEARQGPTRCVLPPESSDANTPVPYVPLIRKAGEQIWREASTSFSTINYYYYDTSDRKYDSGRPRQEQLMTPADSKAAAEARGDQNYFDEAYRSADAGKPVADVLPLVKPVIYYCALDGDELRDRTCYRDIASQVHSDVNNRFLSEYEYGAETDGSLPSLTAPRESGFPKYERPAEQDIGNCGSDAGCVDALYVKAYNDFERAAERWDAQQQRFQQEIDKRIEAGESFWVCMDRQDWQKRVSGLNRRLTPDRCYLIN